MKDKVGCGVVHTRTWDSTNPDNAHENGHLYSKITPEEIGKEIGNDP